MYYYSIVSLIRGWAGPPAVGPDGLPGRLQQNENYAATSEELPPLRRQAD